MTETQCPWCGYDAQASAESGICSECGRLLDATAERRRFMHRSCYWLVVAAAVATIATLLRVLNFGISAAAIALLLAILITGAGAGVSIRQPSELRRLEAVVWARASLWLHLPWIGMSFATPLLWLYLKLMTLGMQPGDLRIRDAIWRSADLLQLMYCMLPLLGFGLWLWRWRVLRRAAGLSGRNDILPSAVAILSLIFAWAWGFLEVAFYDIVI